MAAYAALLSLAQTTDMDTNHSRHLFSIHAKHTLRSIHDYVLFMLSFLQDFPDKASRWEGQIRCVAHETEDIIDHFVCQKMSNYTLMNPPIVKLEKLLIDVTEKLGSIAGAIMEDRPASTSSSSTLAPAHAAASSSSSFAAPTCNDAVIGLQGDLMAIKDRLYGQSSKLQVIPVVGMGGIGKTTLATTVYEDPFNMRHFDIRAWITVSQDYSMKGFRRILEGLADSMKLLKEQMPGDKKSDDYEIALKVFKNLKGRRYLIVMDDVWGTEVWDNVRNIFPDDNNGSRVILTSRILDVATYPDSSCPLHQMQSLTDSESWDLLKQKVFKNSCCPPELIEVGKEIARKCIGLPLAVVLVAGFLSTVKHSPVSWEEICKTVNPVVGQELHEILSSSYTHLPHHLRPCFLFLGCYPEDAKIQASRLVKLWVAEGYLKHEKGSSKSMEEEAEEYLEDLVNRNLVIVNSRKTDGKVKSCSLHDIVRDLCIRIAKEEKFLHVMTKHVLPQGMINERLISFNRPDINKIWGPTIRTILCLLIQKSPSWLAHLGFFRLLRVLDGVGHNPKVLPPQLFELFHLRYLALSCSITIPSTISNLVNLQTLVINSPAFSRSRIYDKDVSQLFLPLEIWRMPQLRHVVLKDLYMLPHPPDGSNLALENLQTLFRLKDLVWNEKMVQMIPNVKKLGLVYTNNQDLHHLKDLHQLEKLDVRGNFLLQGHIPSFPRTLKKLTLEGGGYDWENLGSIGSLPNLQVLKLLTKACDGVTWKTCDEQFPQLKYLLIVDSDPYDWITQSSHFPRLKHLVLRSCRRLEKIPKGIGEIPTLELIEVSACEMDLVKSAMQIKDDQQSLGNEALQIRLDKYAEEKYNSCKRLEEVVQVDWVEESQEIDIEELDECFEWFL